MWSQCEFCIQHPCGTNLSVWDLEGGLHYGWLSKLLLCWFQSISCLWILRVSLDFQPRLKRFLSPAPSSPGSSPHFLAPGDLPSWYCGYKAKAWASSMLLCISYSKADLVAKQWEKRACGSPHHYRVVASLLRLSRAVARLWNKLSCRKPPSWN